MRIVGQVKSTCSKCNNPLEENRIGKYRYCLSCHAEYMRENRKRHNELPDEQRQRANARSYLNVYIRRGKVEKQPCVICGSMEGLEAHHADYSKPLEVTWYCRNHHIDYHNDQRV